MTQAGYSGKTLVQKLGIKPGMRMIILNAPDKYSRALGKLPEKITQTDVLDGEFDYIQFFITSRYELESAFLELKSALKPKGVLWISWPKTGSKLATDINENVIRVVALERGLVDVKVTLIDETWSALKLVFRKIDRKQHEPISM